EAERLETSAAARSCDNHRVVISNGQPVGAQVHRHGRTRRTPAQGSCAGGGEQLRAEVGARLLADEPCETAVVTLRRGGRGRAGHGAGSAARKEHARREAGSESEAAHRAIPSASSTGGCP